MNPQGKKILLVEDEKFIADLYARQLTNAGLVVRVAYDGINGFKEITTQTFDLVLLDIMLPGMNGLELLKEWKQKNPSSTLPVLLLTNLGQEAVIKEGFSLGAQGYLIKASYTPAQVVAEVQNALSGKQAGSPNPDISFTNTPTGNMPTPSAAPSLPASPELQRGEPLTANSQQNPVAATTPVAQTPAVPVPPTPEPLAPTPLPAENTPTTSVSPSETDGSQPH